MVQVWNSVGVGGGADSALGMQLAVFFSMANALAFVALGGGGGWLCEREAAVGVENVDYCSTQHNWEGDND